MGRAEFVATDEGQTGRAEDLAHTADAEVGREERVAQTRNPVGRVFEQPGHSATLGRPSVSAEAPKRG